MAQLKITLSVSSVHIYMCPLQRQERFLHTSVVASLEPFWHRVSAGAALIGASPFLPLQSEPCDAAGVGNGTCRSIVLEVARAQL